VCFRWLGFQIEASVRLERIGREGKPHFWTHYRIDAAIDSPTPRFGTLANKRYEIVLVWGPLEPDHLAQWLATNDRISKDRAVVVFHFRRVNLTARRQIVHAVRRKQYSVLLVDTCLLTWLCSFRAAERTSALFGAALPGGYDNPYMPEAAESVSPEMFFGREDHVDRLWKVDGPCIVFGGRKLGKSALLLEVVRRYHNPPENQYVLYESPKYDTDFWVLLRDIMSRAKLLPKRGLRTPARIKDEILDVVQSQPNMRVLVLLDECDRFLDEDASRGFEQVSRLRDLMTDTRRRFKVVFTGLHSVQRFQRIPNQPLAHFGEPVCVGPLEHASACDLVRVPLNALGYRFEPPSLVNRILALTNRHPNLVQLFCQALVDEIAVRRDDPRTTPPFVIDESSIAGIYRRVDLGKQMRDRFDWTVDLDPRYRALAYTFAFLEHEQYFEAAESILPSDILGWVSDFWPQGFKDTQSNEDEIIGLMEEMKGLGVLVGSQSRGYRLCNPNVLRLLGGPHEVRQELEVLRKRPYQPDADLQVIRRVPRSRDVPASPLTLQQEGRIVARARGIDVILGSDALGLGDVETVLGELLGGRGEEGVSFEVVSSAGSTADSLEEIRRVYQSTRLDGLHVLVWRGSLSIEDHIQLLDRASNWIDRLYSEDRYVRLAFALNPAEIYHLCLAGGTHALSNSGWIQLHRLRRWKEVALRKWFDDVDRTPEPLDAPTKWMTETSGWPLLMRPRLLATRADERNESVGTTGGSPSPATFLSAAGLTRDSATGRLFGFLSEIEEEIDVAEVLVDFASDLGLEREVVPFLVDYLLSLDLAVGSRQRLRAEPLAASFFKTLEGETVTEEE